MRERTQKIPSKITYMPLLFLRQSPFLCTHQPLFIYWSFSWPSPAWIVESTAWDWWVCEPWTWRDRIALFWVFAVSPFSTFVWTWWDFTVFWAPAVVFVLWHEVLPKAFFPLISLNTNETKLSFHFRPAVFHLCPAEGYKGQLHKTHFTNKHCSDILSAESQGVVTNTKGNISLLTFQKIRFWNPFFNSRPWSVGLIGKVPLNSRIASL